jgi:hypothetical protein
MTQDTIAMAREAGFQSAKFWPDDFKGLMGCVERFAALARAAERNKLASWMIAQGYATGHGDTTEDLLKELEWQVRESEREACAKWYENAGWLLDESDVADAIRART